MTVILKEPPKMDIILYVNGSYMDGLKPKVRIDYAGKPYILQKYDRENQKAYYEPLKKLDGVN